MLQPLHLRGHLSTRRSRGGRPRATIVAYHRSLLDAYATCGFTRIAQLPAVQPLSPPETMTPDVPPTRPPTSPQPSSPQLNWYQRRAAMAVGVTVVLLAVTVTALGLTRTSTEGTRRAATERRADVRPTASPQPLTATSKGTNGRATPASTPSSSHQPSTSAQPSTSTTAGSTSSPTGGAGGASAPGAPLNLGGTAFGASLDLANGGNFAQALSTQDRRFGGLDVVRVFYSGFPAPWSSKPQLAARDSVVSFKMPPAQVLSGSYDIRLLQWFRTAPRSANIYWTYWHEPENDPQLNPAQYRAAWQHISALSRQANNPRLRATLILMGYTVRPGSGRDWRDWYPGSATIDVMGWDVYNTGAKKDRYADPAALYGPVAAVSRSIGKPWAIGETGSQLIPGDTGSQRAAWLRQAAQYLDSAGALWAAYWDVDAKGGSFKLSDAPSIAAWRSAVSS